jgi:hypothetical protein
MTIKEETEIDYFGNEDYKSFGKHPSFKDLSIEALEETTKNMISCKNPDLSFRINEFEEEIKLRKRYYNLNNFDENID